MLNVHTPVYDRAIVEFDVACNRVNTFSNTLFHKIAQVVYPFGFFISGIFILESQFEPFLIVTTVSIMSIFAIIYLHYRAKQRTIDSADLNKDAVSLGQLEAFSRILNKLS